jgi:putative transcriptional regulator
MTKIGKRIRALRKESGWSQAQLGERIGVGRIAISGMEQGDRTISIEEAQALARAFGVPLMRLLGEEPQDVEEEGVELRFEVTAKLLPSRQEKQEKSGLTLGEMFEPPGALSREDMKGYIDKRLDEEHRFMEASFIGIVDAIMQARADLLELKKETTQ